MGEMIKEFKKGDLLYIGEDEKAQWGFPEGYPYKEIETILDGTFEFTEYYYSLYAHQITDEDFTVVDGKSYTIIWDGETYQCTATTFGGMPVLGNLGITGDGADTGEPFVFFSQGDKKLIGTNDTAATHTITVLGENIYPIASDFLPLATPTTAGTVKQAAAVANVTAAPTAEEFNALLKSLRDAGILATS